MSSNLPLLPALAPPLAAQHPLAPSSSDAEDGESTSGSDASREAEDDGREPTDVARAHPTPPSVAPASVIITSVDGDGQGTYGDSPQTPPDGEEPMEEILGYADDDEADATVRYIGRGDSDEDELDYDRSGDESEEAVDIDITGLTTQLRSDEAARNSAQGGRAGSGSGGGGGSSGGAGGASGGSGTDAFQSRSKNPLERRSGTGNGSKKGKGWRAAVLPVEIIE